jgi:hypothetical protein
MDKTVIKDALDKFEEDSFVDAKEILTKEIRKTKDAYIKDKLGLKGEPEVDIDTEE